MSDFYQGGNRNKGGNRGGGGFKKFGGDRPKFGGDRGGFGGDRKGGFSKDRNSDRGSFGGERREVVMHNAVCSECGVNCQVPFKPSMDKPVLCNDCFAAKRGSRDDRGERPERREERGTKERYISTPREVKSFDNSTNEKAISEIRNQVSEMGKKIDVLTALIETMTTTSKKVIAKTDKSKKVVKKVSAKKVTKTKAKK